MYRIIFRWLYPALFVSSSNVKLFLGTPIFYPQRHFFWIEHDGWCVEITGVCDSLIVFLLEWIAPVSLSFRTQMTLHCNCVQFFCHAAEIETNLLTLAFCLRIVFITDVLLSHLEMMIDFTVKLKLCPFHGYEAPTYLVHLWFAFFFVFYKPTWSVCAGE